MGPQPKFSLRRATVRWCLAASMAVAVANAGGAESPVTKINAEAASAQIDARPLRAGVTVLSGSGGNIGVLATAQGKFLVDAGIAVSRPRLQPAIEELGTQPIKYLVNTHWHWDHTDGNKWIAASGAKIIAHPNTARHVSQELRVEDWSFTFAPLPKEARPTSMVKAVKELQFDGETVTIRYYGPSHTDGDLSVYFHKADVLFTGDTWWNGVYPFIDYVAGGSIDGMIRAANANIARSNVGTIIVPGHGPTGTRVDLIEYRDMLVAIRDRVAELKQQGLSVEQVIARNPTQPFDAKWGNFVIDPPFFVKLVYRGVYGFQVVRT